MKVRGGISPDVMKLYKDIASRVTADTPLEEALKVLDRGLKIEAIKAKIADDEFGKDFDLGDEPNE